MAPARRFACARHIGLVLALLMSTQALHGRPATPAPPLPPPTGTVINVSTEAQLQSAIQQLASNTTILLAPGTYTLTNTLYINGTFTNVALRGATNNRNDVVLQGPGMNNASYGNVPFGIWTGGNVQGVLIANLTIRGFYFHPIILNAGTQSPRVYNVRLVDAGEQFIKSNPDGSGGGVDSGRVEYSVIEYTSTSRDAYTNGIDVSAGANWIVQHNLFRNIVAPAGQLAGPTILMWGGSSNTLTEGNTFINCARGIAYGLEDKPGSDHVGGIIRNNFFARTSAQPGDVGIYVADSPNTRVLNNTVYVSGTYGTPIEYRFPGSSGIVLRNNLLDGVISARDGATGTEANNVTGATSSMFVNPAAGDLHLTTSAVTAIDQGVTLADVPDDWDGQTRPSGPAPDVGADERTSDMTPPTVSMTAPANGATVSGTAENVSATASDNVGVLGVQFTLDGANLGAEVTTAPYQMWWNTTTVPNGSHSLTAVARDAGGNTATATPVTVTVNNPDTTPPAVNMTAPANGATVSGASVTVSADASDNVGVAGVQFLLDGNPLGSEDTISPYSITWDTTTASNGGHALAARARDAAGNVTAATARNVTVANSGAAPAMDVTVWGDQGVPSSSVTSASFSTGSGNELLLAFVSADGLPPNVTVTGVGGGGLTWQLVRRTNVQLGTAEIWRAFAAAPLNNVTVTATLSQVVSSSMTVVTLTGVDTTGTNGANAIGATASANANPGAPSATLITTRNNSWVFGVGTDWDNPIPRTPGPNQTIVHQYMPPVGDTYWVQRTNAPTPAAGTSVTINDTAPSGDRYNLTLVEVRPPNAGDIVPPTVAMTAPADGATVSGAAVTVSATASDNIGVVGVQFLLDGNPLGSEDTTSPYSIVWDTTTTSNGAHALSARARDAAGNQTTSASRTVSVSNGGGGGSGGLVQSGNLVYQGAFRLPQGNVGVSSFAYGGTALAFNPAGNSLFIVGHDWHQVVAEIGVPQIRSSSNVGDLDTASVLQPFADATEGQMDSVDSGTIKVGGVLPYQSQLYLSAYSYYDADANQVVSHFRSGLNLSVTGDVGGPFQIGTMGAGFVSGYFGLVPSAWQAALGGPVLNGQCCLSIISRTSYGPGVFTINPANIGAQNPVPANALVYYDEAHQTLGAWDGTNPNFNGSTEVKGVVFPEGTRSVLFFGRHGIGTFCYGTGGASGGECYDPEDGSKGTHAYPYRYYVWAYDANDLAAVRAGTRNPWDVMPYAVWPLTFPIASGNTHLQGATYDPATRRIFVSQAYGDNEYPVIHVFTVQMP